MQYTWIYACYMKLFQWGLKDLHDVTEGTLILHKRRSQRLNTALSKGVKTFLLPWFWSKLNMFQDEDHYIIGIRHKQTFCPALLWNRQPKVNYNTIKHCDYPELKHIPSSSTSPDTQTPATFSPIPTCPDSLMLPLSLSPTNPHHQSSSKWWTDRTDDTHLQTLKGRAILSYIFKTHPYVSVEKYILSLFNCLSLTHTL